VTQRPTSVFLTVNGLRLHHLDWGNKDAPPFVFVHGLGGNAHAFDGIARRLSDRYHVISTDVRGRGDSDWAKDGAYQMTDYASDLAGIVDALGFQKFILSGTSMGGRISMHYAAAHPERIERLIIVDIGPDSEAGSERITRNQANVPESFADLDEAIAYRARTNPVFATLSPAEQRERIQYDLRPAPSPGGGIRYYWKHDPEWQRQRVAGGTLSYSHLWQELPRFHFPTLLIWGTASDVLSKAQADRIVAALPQGEIVSVTGVGHAPTLNEPQAVAGLERFLGHVPAV
jgi:pimeloyl-ACP methyl ester carboxylesterase